MFNWLKNLYLKFKFKFTDLFSTFLFFTKKQEVSQNKESDNLPPMLGLARQIEEEMYGLDQSIKNWELDSKLKKRMDEMPKIVKDRPKKKKKKKKSKKTKK